jgi:hypothetical protein
MWSWRQSANLRHRGSRGVVGRRSASRRIVGRARAFLDLQRSHLAMEETASSRLRNGGSRRRWERTGRVRSESFRSLTWQIERNEIQIPLTEHCGVRCGGPVGLRVRQTSRVVQRQRPSNRFDGLTKENDGLCWSVLDCLFQLGSASASAVSSAKKCEINHIQPAQNSIDDRPQNRVVLRI